MIETTWRGLEIEGTVTVDPGEAPSWSSGGSPGGTYVEDIFIVGIDCPDEFESWEMLESGCGVSPGVARMVYAWARISGKLLGTAAHAIEFHYGEEISDALADADAEWEPDFD